MVEAVYLLDFIYLFIFSLASGLGKGANFLLSECFLSYLTGFSLFLVLP
jgi:hypothetical protein